MGKVIRILIFLIFVVDGELASAMSNLDSLQRVWKNESLADTNRLKALETFSREGYLYSQPDSAFYFAQQLYNLAEKKGYSNWMAKALLLQGNTFVLRGNYFKAFEYQNRSLLLSEQSGDQRDLANGLHSIGIIYYYQGDHQKAVEYYMRSLKIRESLDDKQGISKSLNNIGIVYSQQKHYDKAINFFTRSLNLSRELGDKRGVASALNNIGLIYKDEGNLDSAYNYYGSSLEISTALGDNRDIAATMNNIGHIYEQKGYINKALEYFNESLAIKQLLGDRQSIAVTFINIGFIYEKKSDYTQAIKWCTDGLNTAVEIGSLLEQEMACGCLYRSYKAANNELKALEFHEKMLTLNDSIKDAETDRMLQQMEFARLVLNDSIAKAGEREKIQSAHEEEVKKKNQTRNIFIGITILLLTGAIALSNRVRYIRKSRAIISAEKERSDNLLLNILPEDIARELKEKGEATARKFDNVSILFTDFKDFTLQAARLTPEELISELNVCFIVFDKICGKYHIEKIKTIGDAYMVAGGLPVPSPDSARNTVMAALEMSTFMLKRKKERDGAEVFSFEMRAGIHTGTVVAGIVGVKKFQYDIYGDTVNLASRMESNGEPGKVNISKPTYELIKHDPIFRFSPRGELQVKGKGCTEMFYVELCEEAITTNTFPGTELPARA